MAVTDQLGTPSIAYEVDGKYTLTRLHRLAAAAAAPVTPVNVYGIQAADAGAPAPTIEREVFQQGGGDESLLIKRGFRYSGTLSIKSGAVGSFLAQMLGKTWTTAGEAALPMRMPDVPVACLEMIARREDNSTHLFSKVFQDVILRETNFGSPMEDEVVSIPFYSKHDPFILASGAEMVLDKFTGDGSTVEFTLSATPLTLVETDDDYRDDWVLDNAVYVKLWQSASATEGTRQVTGITVVGTALTFSTAPTATQTVEALYAKATA